MKASSTDRLVAVAFGIALGGLFSAALAMPWMEPLRDYVVNGWTNICAAAVAVSGAFLLWTQQQRARERTITDAVVILFDTLLDELNQARLAQSYEGVEVVLELLNPQIEFQPEMVPDFMRHSSAAMLDHAGLKAQAVLDQFHGLQDALPALSARKISACLELYGVAAEAVRRLPEIKLHVLPQYEIGNTEAAHSYMAMFDIGVSTLAYYLNVLDRGDRDASLYESEKARHDDIRTMSRANLPKPPAPTPLNVP